MSGVSGYGELVGVKGVAFGDSFAFADDDPLIGGDVSERFGGSLGPADGDISFGFAGKTEVNSEVTLRDMEAAASDLVDLAAIGGGDGDASADGVATGVGDGAD